MNLVNDLALRRLGLSGDEVRGLLLGGALGRERRALPEKKNTPATPNEANDGNDQTGQFDHDNDGIDDHLDDDDDNDGIIDVLEV